MRLRKKTGAVVNAAPVLTGLIIFCLSKQPLFSGFTHPDKHIAFAAIGKRKIRYELKTFLLPIAVASRKIKCGLGFADKTFQFYGIQTVEIFFLLSFFRRLGRNGNAV